MINHSAQPEILRQPRSTDEITAICAELAQLGFDPPQRFGQKQNMVCGSSLQVSLDAVLADGRAREKLLHDISWLLENNAQVCLIPEKFPAGVSSIESWRTFCAWLRAGLQSRNLNTTNIGFCLHSHRMPLEAYRLVADTMLGCGARYVYLDGLQMLPHSDPRVMQRASANWKFLWRQRAAARPVLPVYGGLVRSACRLLGDEVATAVIPSVSLHAPVGTAWIAIGLFVPRYCTASGELDRNQLFAALQRAVDLADLLFEQVEWPDQRQNADARANRRLAIVVSGLGDLLLRTGRSPQKLATLHWLTGLVRSIREILTTRSTQLAATQEVLPALQAASPVCGWRSGVHRDGWQQRWQIAVRAAAVRHRNLLVLSPSSVLPKTAADSAQFADLLPVLRYADAWSFACEAKMSGWSVAQYKDFHRRARATIQGSQRASFVAAEV